MIRAMFRLLGAMLTGKILVSGSGKRVAGHAVRRQAHKKVSKWMR